MPRTVAPSLGLFTGEITRAVAIAQLGERIRATAPLGSVARRELRPEKLEALYELAYLRLFLAWEHFLEETFTRLLCGHVTAAGPPTLIQAKFPNLNAARIAILHGQDFVSWANPAAVERRSRAFFTAGTHELVIQSSRARISAFNSVRNRIAHKSTFSQQEFDGASMLLAGRRYPASAPGRFLRDWNPAVVPPERYIHSLVAELNSLAAQIV